jgi:hypothetical protein
VTTKDNLTTARTCIFCGSAAGSREHVFPEWLNDVFGYDAKESGPATWRMSNAGVQVREFQKPDVATLVTRRICHGCNTGWMAKLEDRARPILMPMIERRTLTSVSGADAILAATWGVKTAMTLATAAATEVDHWFPAGDCAIVCSQDRPPSNYNVFAASLAGPAPAISHAAAMASVDVSTPNDGGIYTYTIQVGGLVLQSNRTTTAIPKFPGLDRMAAPSADEIPLFPPVPTFDWPPLQILDWNGFVTYTTRGVPLHPDWTVEWQTPSAT